MYQRDSQPPQLHATQARQKRWSCAADQRESLDSSANREYLQQFFLYGDGYTVKVQMPHTVVEEMWGF
jgi:hypothetical protein